MPLLNLQSAPRLDQIQNIATWCRDITDYLNDRTAQLILPFNIVTAVDTAVNEDLALPAGVLIGIQGPTGAFFVGGLAGGILGRYVILMNLTGQAMGVVEEDSNSQPQNQIFNWGVGSFGANVVQLVHLGDNGSWVVIGSR